MQTPITSNLVVITGGPGVGKTTLINHLNDRGFDTSPEVARAIIEQRIMSDEPRTLEELGREMGVSKERVRQLEVRAREKLRRELAEFQPAAA